MRFKEGPRAPSKFARGNVAETANRVCQLFQPRRVSVPFRSGFAFSGHGPNSRAAAHSWAGSWRGRIDFSLVLRTSEMQAPPAELHLLAREFANISSSTFFSLRFRILRQAEELKCSFGVGNEKYWLSIVFDIKIFREDNSWKCKKILLLYFLFYFCSPINGWILSPEK